jgi:squalene-hopene/tetraprenyl-beta-curcumene cyclase
MVRGLRYLARAQQRDGSWLPLWFGNQDHARDENPVYGTSKVLLAYRDLGLMDAPEARRGLAWLKSNQNTDGGWGGGMSLDGENQKQIVSSNEETALALEGLLAAAEPTGCSSGTTHKEPSNQAQVQKSSPAESFADPHLLRGLEWLVSAVEADRFRTPSPIGFYFAKLWYYERLYPIIFTTSALGQAVKLMSATTEQSAKSHLLSVATEGAEFPKRTEPKRQLVSNGKEDGAAPNLKQPCP